MHIVLNRPVEESTGEAAAYASAYVEQLEQGKPREYASYFARELASWSSYEHLVAYAAASAVAAAAIRTYHDALNGRYHHTGGLAYDDDYVRAYAEQIAEGMSHIYAVDYASAYAEAISRRDILNADAHAYAEQIAEGKSHLEAQEAVLTGR